jgi:mannose-6-phosphate isomerase-like protein (cupin superfamily)
MTKTIALLFAAATLAFSADPAGLHVWKASALVAQGKEMAKKVDAHKVASAPLAAVGNRSFSLAHREGSGQVEWHEKQADILVIESGTVTVIYGGTMVGEKTTAPGEKRADSIKGGEEATLTVGDVIHIPSKTPHQMKLAPGQSLTYFVTKVVE